MRLCVGEKKEKTQRRTYCIDFSGGRQPRRSTTVKDPQTLPRDLVADEKLTRVAKQQVYVPTTVGGGCFLGVSVVKAADTVNLERGYGEFAKEARALAPAYKARSVCTDGWEATRQAWRGLFPTIKLALCFLHSILKITKHCAGQLRHQVLDKAWQVYESMEMFIAPSEDDLENKVELG